MDPFYPWVHSNNSFISTKMSLKLSGDVDYDFDGAFDHFYPWVYSNNSFTLNKSSWNSVEICRMTLAVLWIEYTLGFIQITLLHQEKCPWNSVEMCRITLVVLWTNFTYKFILLTLLFAEKCPWNLVNLCTFWTYGWNWSKAPPKSFYTSPLSSKDMFLETTELLEWTHG